jgi:hypothetical protein
MSSAKTTIPSSVAFTARTGVAATMSMASPRRNDAVIEKRSPVTSTYSNPPTVIGISAGSRSSVATTSARRWYSTTPNGATMAAALANTASVVTVLAHHGASPRSTSLR